MSERFSDVTLMRNGFKRCADGSFIKVKRNVSDAPEVVRANQVEVEGPLHDEIMDACRKMGWLFFHGAMSERTHRTEGEPDFIIVTAFRVLFVECKSRKGKLSPAQRNIEAHLKHLGQVLHVVRSKEEFMQIAVAHNL